MALAQSGDKALSFRLSNCATATLDVSKTAVVPMSSKEDSLQTVLFKLLAVTKTASKESVTCREGGDTWQY